MRITRKHLKLIFKFGFLCSVLIIVIWTFMLSYPSVLFNNNKQYKNFTIYSDQTIGPEIDTTISQVKEWLEQIEVYNKKRKIDIYLCYKKNQFRKISFFTLRKDDVMGINLPELSNCVINISVVEKFGQLTNKKPKYHSREGNLSHVIAHELMHQYIADWGTTSRFKKIPTWKLEGYCEFGANYVRAKMDCVSLENRLRVYYDDTEWNITSETHRGHYLWGIMVEYLSTRKEMSFDQIMKDEITFHRVYDEMIKDLMGENFNNREKTI